MKKDWNIIAVYWTLKKWFWNYWVMERAKGVFIREDFVEFTHIVSWWFPMIKFWKNEGVKKFIKVELFSVPEEWIINSLDRLEWHPTFYKRKDVTTVIDEEPCVTYNIVDSIWDSSERFKIDKPSDDAPEWDYFDWK